MFFYIENYKQWLPLKKFLLKKIYIFLYFHKLFLFIYNFLDWISNQYIFFNFVYFNFAFGWGEASLLVKYGGGGGNNIIFKKI